jgi:hypothetical protein
MRGRGRTDATAVAAGLAVAAVGILLILDGTGAAELRFAVLGPVACAVLGVTLLVSGLTRRE